MGNNLILYVYREEIEKQKAHERYMRLQEQGKTEQARKDLGKYIDIIEDTILLCISYFFLPILVFSFIYAL